MPRKPSAELITNPPISLRFPPEVRSQLVQLAAREHRTLSAQIVHLVMSALANEQKAAADQEGR